MPDFTAMLQHVRLATLALGLCACAQRAHPPVTPPPSAPAPAPASESQPDARAELAPDASYADLVRLAAQLDGEPREAPCVLEQGARGVYIAGSVTAALRPLPQPAADLDVALERSASVNLLSAFGRYGDAPGALTFVAFSATQPTRGAAALVLTERGLYVRGAGSSVAPAHYPTLAALLAALEPLRGLTLFVAAEAHVPLRELSALLAALGARNQPAVLAVNLAPGTALPAARPAAGDALCPAGLPDSNEPQGELSVAELQAGALRLRERAAECLGRGEAPGAAGGKLMLALRVGADGRVAAACMTADETGDALLRACVLAEARALTFAAPAPRGSVDVALPLALRAQLFAAPALLCLH